MIDCVTVECLKKISSVKDIGIKPKEIMCVDWFKNLFLLNNLIMCWRFQQFLLLCPCNYHASNRE